MNGILAALAIAATIDAGTAAASTRVVAPAAATPPPAGSVFADLSALGYDLGKFRPDYPGRLPYR